MHYIPDNKCIDHVNNIVLIVVNIYKMSSMILSTFFTKRVSYFKNGKI